VDVTFCQFLMHTIHFERGLQLLDIPNFRTFDGWVYVVKSGGSVVFLLS